MVMPPPREKPTMLNPCVHYGNGEDEAANRSCRPKRRASWMAFGEEE